MPRKEQEDRDWRRETEHAPGGSRGERDRDKKHNPRYHGRRKTGNPFDDI